MLVNHFVSAKDLITGHNLPVVRKFCIRRYKDTSVYVQFLDDTETKRPAESTYSFGDTLPRNIRPRVQDGVVGTVEDFKRQRWLHSEELNASNASQE